MENQRRNGNGWEREGMMAIGAIVLTEIPFKKKFALDTVLLGKSAD